MSQNQKNVSDTPLGNSTDDSGHENYANELNEPIALKAKVQLLETENKQLVEANKQLFEEKKIHEDKCSKLEKEMREKSLKRKLQESPDEFAEQKFRSLEEKYLKENAELKLKNQKLTEENKAFEEKMKKLEEMKQQKISETENEIMESDHKMKVLLPRENWHDLLAFVPRSQLGNVVSEIGDYHFADIIQSFLHDEVRKITLGEMEIIPPRRNLPNDQPVVKVWSNVAANMPDWPMPGNIKSFVEINLNYVDMSVLHFLEKFQENSLLTNVNICFDFGYSLRIEEEIVLERVLTKIAPFITSIDSITSTETNLFVYDNNVLEEMMETTRILLTNWCADESGSWEFIMDWYCSWLYTPRNDGKPRMLKSYENIYDPNCHSFIERIKQDFEMANNPASFFIYVGMGHNNDAQDIPFENVKTQEKLVVKTIMHDLKWKMLLISRYPLNAAKKWIEANEKEIYEWNPEKLNRRINMDQELTIEAI